MVNGLRILLVEDNAINAMLLEHVLIGMGFIVSSIEATEVDAVRAARRDKPDLMIVDSRLAEGNGIAAMAQVLQDGFVPHVFVSGDTLTDRVLDPRAVVVQKPYGEADLFSAIQRALDPHYTATV